MKYWSLKSRSLTRWGSDYIFRGEIVPDKHDKRVDDEYAECDGLIRWGAYQEVPWGRVAHKRKSAWTILNGKQQPGIAEIRPQVASTNQKPSEEQKPES